MIRNIISPNKIILGFMLIIISILASIYIFSNEKMTETYLIRWILSLVIILIAITLSRMISRYFNKLNIPHSKNFANLIDITFLIVVALSIMYIWGVDTSILIQSSVFLGLVIGLALQPVLANLFAGIIILSTRYVEVGKKVKILSYQIPYGLVILPAYKFMSVEHTDLGYRGVIKKVTLFYSIFETDDGDEMKIPNSILLQSVILDAENENKIFSIRVEFPLKLKVNLEELENKIRETLKDFEIVDGPYFNEQSDKDYVFIKLWIKSNNNWKKTKSEVLKRLLTLKNELTNTEDNQKT